MTRDLISIRHALAVLAGAAIMWVANTAVLPTLALVPGFADQVAEWLTLHRQPSAFISLLLFLALAAVASLVQETRQMGRGRAAVFLGLVFGLITFDSRVSSTPQHLHDVAAIFAAVRGFAVIGAGLLISHFKAQRTENDKPVVSVVR